MLTLPAVVGGLVLVKAVDVLLRGPEVLPAPLWLAVLGLWVAAGTGLVVGFRHRACWAGVALAGAGLALDLPLDLRRQHLVLLIGVAVVGAVTADDGERLLLWRTQLSALYGVAALAKLNESFLGGNVLAGALVGGPLDLPLPPLPVLALLGVTLIAAEVLLALAPWVARLRRAALLVALALHGTAPLVVGGGPLVTLRLVVFGGTAVALCAVSAAVLPVRRSASDRP